jgi:hypothetical protein
MDYRISLTDGTSQVIQIISVTFKKLKVWKLTFISGKDIMLYKVGTQWLQRSEDYLEQCYVITIGAFIDRMEATNNLSV